MSGTFEYTGQVQLNDGSTVDLDLEERGWAEPNRLAETRVFSLIPKTTSWPTIHINIPEGAKPIFKSRRSVGMTAGFEFRSYAVGWFKDGESHWTWITPNGVIETETDDPRSIDSLTESLNDQWRVRTGAPNGDQA